MIQCVLICCVYYSDNITMTLICFSDCAIDFVHVALCVVHIRVWTVCSHFMLGRTFYVTFIPVTVCKCHIELKAI